MVPIFPVYKGPLVPICSVYRMPARATRYMLGDMGLRRGNPLYHHEVLLCTKREVEDARFCHHMDIGLVFSASSEFDASGEPVSVRVPDGIAHARCVVTNRHGRDTELATGFAAMRSCAASGLRTAVHCNASRHRGPPLLCASAKMAGSTWSDRHLLDYTSRRRDPDQRGYVWEGHRLGEEKYRQWLKERGMKWDQRDVGLFGTHAWISSLEAQGRRRRRRSDGMHFASYVYVFHFFHYGNCELSI